jgi:hypothetical protein
MVELFVRTPDGRLIKRNPRPQCWGTGLLWVSRDVAALVLLALLLGAAVGAGLSVMLATYF